MTTYTPTYLLPSPALGETADGPAAVAALATRVERELPTLRATNEYNTGSVSCPGGTTTTVANIDVPTSVIGWMTIDAYWYMSIDGLVDSIIAQVAAGTVQALVNNVVVRTIPWHTLWSTRMNTGSFVTSVARTAADTTANFKLRVAVNGGDPPLTCYGTNIYACQFGAPAIG